MNTNLITTLESSLAIAKGLEPAPWTPPPLPEGYEIAVPEGPVENWRWVTKGSETDTWTTYSRGYDCHTTELFLFARPIPTPWTLPAPPPGQQWYRTDGWTQDMLPEGYRPLLLGEPRQAQDEIQIGDKWKAYSSYQFPDTIARAVSMPTRTTRPLPEPPAGWDCPSDLGFPWPLLRQNGCSPDSYGIAYTNAGGIRLTHGGFIHWSELANYEHSRDGVTFNPCTKQPK